MGRCYELYDEQVVRASLVLGLKLLAQGRGVHCRCGVPVTLGLRCAQTLVMQGIPVALIRETEDRAWLGGVKPRVLAVVWQPAAV